MEIITVSLPIFLLIALGVYLIRSEFFTDAFVNGLNAFVYRIGLPALIVSSLTSGPLELGAAAPAIKTLSAGALLMVMLALVTGWLLGERGGALATFTQGSFRGNLAFVGLPILASASRGENAAFLATAVLVFAPLMLLYNVVAVLLFQLARDQETRRWANAFSGLASNPLIIAAIVGGLIAWLLPPLPDFLSRTLDLLATPAAPLALLAIGAAIGRASVRERFVPTMTTSLLKVVALPALTFLLAIAFQLDREALQIAVIFAACPSAAASYIIAKELGGDARLASNTVVATTLMAPVSLTIALALCF